MKIFLASITAVVVVGCNKPNANYCDEQTPCPNGGVCDLQDHSCEAVDARPPSCSEPADCTTSALPYCDTATMTCRQCGPGEASACTGDTPACDEVNHVCRGCAADAECASEVCLPDGACAAEATVVYAAPGEVDTTPCSRANPCSFAGALALVMGPVTTVKLAPGQYDLAASVTIGVDVTIVGRGAILDRNAGGNGPVLSIAAGGRVAVFYVTVQNGDGTGGDGIKCLSGAMVTLVEATLTSNDESGIDADNCIVSLDQSTVSANTGGGIAATGGTLTVSQSTVSANTGGGIAATGGTLTVSQSTVSANTGGGIAATGGTLTVSQSTVSANTGGGIAANDSMFTITNNFIIDGNGSATALIGGIDVRATIAGMRVIAFNTIANNDTNNGFPAGINCSAVGVPLTFSNNIIVGNQSPLQVGGVNCDHTYSNIEQTPLPAGTGNINQAPTYVDAPGGDYHLAAGSAGAGVADPVAILAIDVDGEPRPQPSPGRADMGADEIP